MEDILEDEQDLDDQDHDLKINGVNWTNLGHQLTEIASAFEVSYAPAMTPTQRIVYQEYRKLKAKSLALSREEKNLMGLAKTVCRQMLLSSIWILMKKFIWSILLYLLFFSTLISFYNVGNFLCMKI